MEKKIIAMITGAVVILGGAVPIQAIADSNVEDDVINYGNYCVSSDVDDVEDSSESKVINVETHSGVDESGSVTTYDYAFADGTTETVTLVVDDCERVTKYPEYGGRTRTAKLQCTKNGNIK